MSLYASGVCDVWCVRGKLQSHLCVIMDSNQSAPKKEAFSSGVGFVLACIGSAVGLGNIWRFPVMISQFGGLTFLIPYLVFVALIAYTGVIGEYSLGRASGKGPIGAIGWGFKYRGMEKLGRFLGCVPVLASYGLAIGYSVIMGWVLYYIYLSATWQIAALGNDVKALEATFGGIACAHGCDVAIVVATVVCLLILGFGVASGIERANRILLPSLAVLFVVLGTYICFLPGASDGYKYIFALDVTKMFSPRLLIFAFGQAFFSLSVAGNVGIIFGSYLSKSEDIPKSSWLVAIFDTIAALLATFVIIPAIGITGTKLSVGGPGLMFIYLQAVFNGIPGGAIVETLFFISVASAGVTTLITIYEPSIALLKKKLKVNRWTAATLILSVGCFVAILCQDIVSPWMDVISIYCCPLGALLAAIAFFWMLGKDESLNAVNEGAAHPVGEIFHAMGKFVYCLAAFFVIVAGALLGGIG